MPKLSDDPFHCRWCELEARAAANPQADPPAPTARRWEFEPDPEEIGDEPVDVLGAFRVGDCVTLTRLPAGLLEEIDRAERADYESLVGDRFEIWSLQTPNVVTIARNHDGPGGEQGWDCFTMPLELLEPAEWDDEPGA